MSDEPKTRKEQFQEAIAAIQKVGNFAPPLETSGTIRTLKRRLKPIVDSDLSSDDDLPGEVWRFLEKEFEFDRKSLPSSADRAEAREKTAEEAEKAVEGDGSGKVGEGLSGDEKEEAGKKVPDLKKGKAKDAPPEKATVTETRDRRIKKKLSRVESVVLALQNDGPTTFSDLSDVADAYYAEGGGNANLKESRWYSNLVLSSFIAAGYATRTGDAIRVNLP